MSFILGVFTGVAIMCVLSVAKDENEDLEMYVEEKKDDDNEL